MGTQLTDQPGLTNQAGLNPLEDVYAYLIPPEPGESLRANHQSDQKLQNLHKLASNALETGDYKELKASNPELGTLLETLGKSGLSVENQKAVLAMVFKNAEKMSEETFSPSSTEKLSDRNILSGVNPNYMTEKEALKAAALIVAAIVAESARNAQEEQKRMQEIQARIGAIPGSVKATVMAEYDVAHMTNGEIIAAIDREMRAQHKDKNGDVRDVVTNQSANIS